MKIDSVFSAINAIIAALTLLFICLSVQIAWQALVSGPIPEKSLTSNIINSSDALIALKSAGGAISVSVKAGDKPLSNLFVVTAILTNTGHAPILRSDIDKNITLSTVKPWEIIAITSPSSDRGISFNWTKANETEFSAEPALINSGDVIVSTVYITHSTELPAGVSLRPPLFWNTRIANLAAIMPEKTTTQTIDPGIFPLIVLVYGNGLLFLLVSFSIYTFSYLYLLMRNGILYIFNIKSIIIVLISSIFSLAAAESATFYLFRTNLILKNNNEIINLPIIIFNFVLLGVLIFIYFRSHSSKPVQLPG
jgi:hypothetical protein